MTASLMPALRRGAPAIAFAMVLPLTAGCGGAIKVPTAGFSGVKIQNVQHDQARRELELDVDLKFRFNNPWPFDLNVPAHEFRIELDNQSWASVGTHGALRVPAGGASMQVYNFGLDLSAAELRNLLGRDVEYAFVSEINVPLPAELQSPLMSQVTIQMEHADMIRLPKLPGIAWPEGGRPSVRLVGANSQDQVDVAEFLSQHTRQAAPFVDVLIDIIDGADNVTIPVNMLDLLESVGVPRAAARTLGVPSTVQVPLPQQGNPLANLGAGGNTPRLWQDFRAGWEALNNAQLNGILVVPESMPEGLRIEVPFVINNQNHFDIQAPTFQFSIIDDEGRAVSTVRTIPVEALEDPAAMEDGWMIPALTAQEMVLVSEVSWNQAPAGFMSLGAGAELAGGLQGEMVLDLGYGPLRLPVNLPAPPPPRR